MPETSPAKALTFKQLRLRIAANIQSLRREKRVTLAMLSARTGLSIDKLDRFELGYGEINLLCLLRIATALEVDMQHLFASSA